jgi:hypothetical protein
MVTPYDLIVRHLNIVPRLLANLNIPLKKNSAGCHPVPGKHKDLARNQKTILIFPVHW